METVRRKMIALAGAIGSVVVLAWMLARVGGTA